MAPVMPGGKSAASIGVKILAGLTLCGIIQGSLLATRESALPATIIAGSIFGLLGLMVGARAGRMFGAMTQNSSSLVFGGFVGTILGAIAGATIGVLIAAFLGTALGVIAGVVIAELLNYCGLKRINMVSGAILARIGRGSGAGLLYGSGCCAVWDIARCLDRCGQWNRAIATDCGGRVRVFAQVDRPRSFSSIIP